MPDVAMTLDNLGLVDSAQKRMEEARKEYGDALKIRRELAQKNRETYLPYVAGTLNNLGILDSAEGRMEEAREEYAEALLIYETFANQDPERFSADAARVKKLMEDAHR